MPETVPRNLKNLQPSSLPNDERPVTNDQQPIASREILYNDSMKPESEFAARMATAVKLHECGLDMMRQRLAREGRDLSPDAVEQQFRRWLFREDDTVPGDVSGPVRTQAPGRR